jgi:hypothetical protein
MLLGSGQASRMGVISRDMQSVLGKRPRMGGDLMLGFDQQYTLTKAEIRQALVKRIFCQIEILFAAVAGEARFCDAQPEKGPVD